MATPRPAAMWPLTVSAGAADRIDVSISSTPYVATVAPATYYTPASLAAAVQAALTAAVANSWAVSVTSSGRVQIAGASVWEAKWSTGPNVARSIGDTLGYATFADSGLGTTHTSTWQHRNAWYADDPVLDDTGDLPLHERSQAVAIAGPAKSLHHGTRHRRVIELGFLEAWKWRQGDEGVTHLNESIERLVESGWARLRWFPDQTDLATGTDYVLALDTAKTLPRDRLAPGAPLYRLPLRLLRYV